MALAAAVARLGGGVWMLAKEVGKGGGGDTEEPTVCATLLPVGIGLAFVAWQSLRQRRPRPACA